MEDEFTHIAMSVNNELHEKLNVLAVTHARSVEAEYLRALRAHAEAHEPSAWSVRAQ